MNVVYIVSIKIVILTSSITSQVYMCSKGIVYLLYVKCCDCMACFSKMC